MRSLSLSICVTQHWRHWAFASRSIRVSRGWHAMQRLWSGDRGRALALQGRAGRRRLAAREGIDQRLGGRAVEILVKVVIDLDDRRVDAGAEAFDFGERELAVGGGLADIDA